MEQPNLSYIYSMSGGDKAFEQKLIDIIKNEFPAEKQVYFTNFEAENFKATAESVHKLKHKISILGLEKSYKLAQAYETNLLENTKVGHLEFEAVLKIITEYLKQL
ncbi:Hpt domain-containing protein [Psychroserpens sp. S379A]|uniref:Hpt domain-containing protein n=1 Tax=Psychroserpens sp. S379A TaxID=3415137 RepID=UPI003C7EABCB